SVASLSARSGTRLRSVPGMEASRRESTRHTATTPASRTSPTLTGTAGCFRNGVIARTPTRGENAVSPRSQHPRARCSSTIGAVMGLPWQQGPFGRNPNGTFITATPMPARVLYLEPLRRRMSVRFGGREIARSDGALILFEPARYPVAYFPIGDVEQGVLQPADHESTHADLGTTNWFDVVGGDGQVAKRGAWQ